MAIFDPLKRMVGIETAGEAEAAEKRAWDELLGPDRNEPLKHFAREAAAGMRQVPDDVVRRIIPEVAEIGDGRMPRGKWRREVHIAKAAEAYGERFLRHGDNHRLGAELGEASRLYVLATTDMRNSKNSGDKPLAAQVEARAARVAAATETYIGTGPIHEHGLNAAASDSEHSIHARPLSAERRAAAEKAVGPLDAERFAHDGFVKREPAGSPVSVRRAVMAYEVAQARAGVLSPGQVVAAANAIDTGRMMQEIARHAEFGVTFTPVRPDFRNVGMDPKSARYAEIVARQFHAPGDQVMQKPSLQGEDPMIGSDRRLAASAHAMAQAAARGL